MVGVNNSLHHRLLPQGFDYWSDRSTKKFGSNLGDVKRKNPTNVVRVAWYDR